MNPLNIIIVTEDKEVSEKLINNISEEHEISFTTKQGVIPEVDKGSPDILIFVEENGGAEIEAIQSIKAEYEIPFIAYFGHSEDFVTLREVTRAGADEFYIYPDELGLFAHKFPAITESIASRVENASSGIQAFKRGKGKVYSFFSGKGGSGTTTMSLSLAQTLKLESTARVLFIDMNLLYGGAETFFGIESNRSLADLLPVIEELNEMHIQNVLEFESHSKLEMLLSPCDAEFAEEITEEFVKKLIRTSRRIFDFVIIDLPHSMSVNTFTALEESDKIYYVMTLDTPSFKMFQRIDDLFQRLSIRTEDRLEFFVNKVSKDNEIKVGDLSNLIEYPIALEVRKDIKGVQASVNIGEPMHKSSDDKKIPRAAKDIRKWVRAFLK